MKLTPCRTALLFACLFQALTCRGTIGYSTLYPGGEYDSTTATAIQGSSAFNGYQAWGDRFISSGTGLLTSIELGLHYEAFNSSPSDVMDVRLSLDFNDPVNGNLPSTNNLATGTVTPTTSFGEGGLVTFSPTNSALLIAGTAYWVVVQPHFAATLGVWNENSTGTYGGIAVSLNGTTWGQNPSALQNAFRVNIGAIPEPSTIALVAGLGVAVMLCWRMLKA